jgi:hypothetical protein
VDVGLIFAAAPVTGAADAIAIMTPATIATTPPIAPPASPRMVQVEAGGVLDPGPSPANGVPLWGLDRRGRRPFHVRFSRAAAPSKTIRHAPGKLNQDNDLGQPYMIDMIAAKRTWSAA